MQAPEQETSNNILGPMEQEDNVITQFLKFMEDQDLHRDSSAMIKSFLKFATLDRFEQCSMTWTGSWELFQDRNLSHFLPLSQAADLSAALRCSGKMIM